MAKDGENGPTQEEVQQAFDSVVGMYSELASERGAYMQRCGAIRKRMAEVYDAASEKGITRRVLKAKVKEHEVRGKLLAIREGLEADDRSEFDQLTEKLGDFGGTPLGTAALDAAKRADGLDELTHH
jgi:chorismate mutase